MCGRYELNETPARLGARYRIDAGDLEFAPNADVRPTETNPVVLLADGQRVASMRRPVGPYPRIGPRTPRRSASPSTPAARRRVRSLLGPSVKVLVNRGKFFESEWGPRILVTVHPSSILRVPPEDREQAFEALVKDIARIKHSS